MSDIEHDPTTGLYQATIDGHLYEFQKWSASVAFNTLLDLSQILGKPLSRFGAVALEKGPAEAIKTEMHNDVVGTVIAELIEQVTSNRAMVLELIKRVTTHKVLRDNKKLNFDMDYNAGDLPHLWRVSRVALEVQFGNFSNALDAIMTASAPARRPKATAAA